MGVANSRILPAVTLVMAAGCAAPATGPAASDTQQCVAAALQVAQGDGISPETGEHPFDVRITNNGTARCWLRGYPTVAMLDAAGYEMPFSYHDGGGYVTSATPSLIWLAPGQQAALVFAKYRCDLGDNDVGASVELRLPGVSGSFTIDVDPARPTEDYCGPNDPGDDVSISPVEPDLERALSPWPAPPPASSPAS